MPEIETGYLVVGAGASGMAFVDALLAGSDARVVLVDRRHRPGGHWLDAYPFVRLHQPSANYGVTSRRLGEDRIDETGINAGCYERASADEICDYYARVLDTLVGTGRVTFLGMSDYRGQGAQGHQVVSLLNGASTTVRAKTLVDATYVASEIPSRHTPPYAIDPGVRHIPPNDLTDLGEAPRGFTVIGAGKTAMDTCNWLLDHGVDPDRIEWIRPRDSWLFDRATVQPLDLVGSYMQMQARWVAAAAEAGDGAEFCRLLEEQDVFLRIDPEVEPEVFRGPTISVREMAGLRSLERVVRRAKVRSLGAHRIVLDRGEIPTESGHVFVDCTARGVRPTTLLPVFAPGRITLQFVTVGFMPWSAATIGTVEAARSDVAEKNRLCPPLTFTGNASDVLGLAYTGMTGLMARAAEPDLARWNDRCRLNPALGAGKRAASDPRVADALGSLGTHIGPALTNLARRCGPSGRAG